MSKFFNFKIALPVAISVIGSGSALAALNCTTQPTCEQLGYSKTVDSNCEDYILCPFDTSYKKCITGKIDCTELGFTQENKSGWCGNVITCPTDASYTLCAEAFENPCPNGYDSRLTSVADCGEQGSNGWTFSTQTITGNSGENITCGKCTPKTCSGYYEQYQSVDDCGSTGSQGWQFATCYSGDDKLGKCTAYTCKTHPQARGDSSYVNDGTHICKTVSVSLGNSKSTCYSCASCSSATKYPGWIDKRDIGQQGALTYCYNHQNYTGAYGTSIVYGTFSDSQGRSATRCYVMSTHSSGQMGVTCDGCCKNGSYDSSNDCYRGWKEKICAKL